MDYNKEFDLEKKQIADMVKRVRAYANLSQRDLSRLTGISQSDISKLERGISNPSLQTIARIMSATGSSLSFDYTIHTSDSPILLEGWENKIDESFVNVVRDSANMVVDSLGDEIKQVILFGSCARGDNTKDSDIDIALLTKSSEETNERFGHDLASISAEIMNQYQELVNFICVPYARFEKEKSWYLFYKNIEKEGIVIYG